MTDHEAVSATTFKTLGIAPNILSILERMHFSVPTPIQQKTIPAGIEGKDLVGIAQTGTGKTLAFGIPMVQRILAERRFAVVLVPTRELATQVEETIRKIGGPLGVTSAVVIGGESIRRQVSALRTHPHIIIATPGRLLDHLRQKTVILERVSILVLDEADHMFDMGFMPQISEILKKIPKERQTMLFSATMPDPIVKLATAHMHLPLRIEVAPQGTAAHLVEQEIIVVKRDAKFSLLVKVLGEEEGSALVFSRTKHGARKIAHALRDTGFSAAEIHSNRSLGQRREALDGFKRGKYRVLVATDIAARGIDVKDIGTVVNYDLPEAANDYVHRIGRTGRAGKGGKAISFATPEQRRDIQDIERLIRKTLPVKRHEGASLPMPNAFRLNESRMPFHRRGSFTSSRGSRDSRAPQRGFNRFARKPSPSPHASRAHRADGRRTFRP